jgi:hypothetical protein
MSRLATTTILVALLAGTAAAQDKPPIQKLNDEWAAAFNKGDSHAVVSLYTEDAYVLPAGAEMVHGRQAIQGFMDSTMKQLGEAKLTHRGRTAARAGCGARDRYVQLQEGECAPGCQWKVHRRLAQNQ